MTTPHSVPLNWTRDDIEQRLMFRGGRYTTANTWLSLLMGCILFVVFYAALIPFQDTQFAKDFTNQGSIPYFTCFFASWAIAILFLKSSKSKYQKRCLMYTVVPDQHDFVLSSATVDQVMEKIYATVDDPRHFVLFNRIVIALSNLKNLGQVGDVDDILRSQAENDESVTETSYMLLGAFIWAIPVLGFIGTVLGLSYAIGGFGDVLQKTSSDMSAVKQELQKTTAGLAMAFVTTLQALVAAMGIQIWMTFEKKGELEFLDECSSYCLRNVVNRLRLMPYESGSQTGSE